MFVAVDARRVRGVSDVKNDRYTWFKAKCGHSRAITANLFLNGVKTIDRSPAPGWQGGKICENLADDEAADAIIDRYLKKPALLSHSEVKS